MKLKTWDGNNINDGTNYDAILNANFYGLPGIRAVLGERHGSWPILGGVERPGRELNFEIYIRSGSSLELEQWFDPEDETAKQLIAEDNAGGNDRFVNAICTELREVPFSAGLHYAVSLQIDGDVRWRETSITTASAWSITATGQTKVVDNNGQDKTFPIIKISPTGARASGGFAYKRWIPVRWNSNNSSGGNYPVDIVNNSFDTDALTTAKMQADGDDLRVWVNGSEVERWLQDMDTATTQVWVNLIFQPKQEATLDGAHNDSVTTFTVNGDISGFPSSGILHVNTETLTYTGKDISLKQFTGCTRGAKTTSAAAHGDTDAIWWVQHDIWILYGNAAMGAPDLSNTYMPMFELSSTNASWDFNDFRETGQPNRPGSWQTTTINKSPEFYGGNQDSEAEPWAEIGINCDEAYEIGRISLNNPCGITAANFVNGEKWAETKAYFWAYILSSLNGNDWTTEYTITDPSADETWEAWNQNETLESDSKHVCLYCVYTVSQNKVEAADVTLTITDEPTVTIGAEVTNYDLDCIITNNATGEAIRVTFSMELNEELEVDSDDKTIILLDDNSNQFQALELLTTIRKGWLALDVGNNTLQFDDVGTGNVTITLTWWERYYQ